MKIKTLALAVALATAAAPAMATNGYFSHGFGIKAKGMAGVGIAYPADSLAAATNPAGMVMVGSRMDVGIDWFRPDRSASIVGNEPGFGPGMQLNGNYDGNGDKSFLIPEFGYNRMLSPTSSLGVAVYGNGGMNTRYNDSAFAAGFLGQAGQDPSGVNLEQLFVAPTYAMKSGAHAFGISLVFARQQFGATGLQAFGQATMAPNNLTDKGNDETTGWGVRIGWTGQLSDKVTLGATYASKIDGKFEDYKGLFAEGGGFDIPENYGIGIAVKATPQLTLAADIQTIKYGSVKSIANPLSKLFVGNPLGSKDGPGFGWEDVTTYKLAAVYAVDKNLTVRAGYSTNEQPVPSSETFFNILAPGVVENHVTLGATWTLAGGNELSVSYMHAFNKDVKGSNSIPPGSPMLGGFGGGNANLRMDQDAVGIAYGIKF